MVHPASLRVHATQGTDIARAGGPTHPPGGSPSEGIGLLQDPPKRVFPGESERAGLLSRPLTSVPSAYQGYDRPDTDPSAEAGPGAPRAQLGGRPGGPPRRPQRGGGGALRGAGARRPDRLVPPGQPRHRHLPGRTLGRGLGGVPEAHRGTRRGRPACPADDVLGRILPAPARRPVGVAHVNDHLPRPIERAAPLLRRRSREHGLRLGAARGRGAEARTLRRALELRALAQENRASRVVARRLWRRKQVIATSYRILGIDAEPRPARRCSWPVDR